MSKKSQANKTSFVANQATGSLLEAINIWSEQLGASTLDYLNNKNQVSEATKDIRKDTLTAEIAMAKMQYLQEIDNLTLSIERKARSLKCKPTAQKISNLLLPADMQIDFTTLNSVKETVDTISEAD